VIPPDNAWLRRSNNDIIIGCYSSQQTWQLTCDGHDWKGIVGTCPELYAGTLNTPSVEDNHSMIVMATLVATVGTALIICVTIMIVGCLCLKRYKRLTTKQSSTPSASLLPRCNVNSTCARPPVSAGTQSFGNPQSYSYCDDQQQFLSNNVGT
jgi:hypothetical protein